MTIEFADGFDHYGSGSTGRANMLLGAWAEVNTNSLPQTTIYANETHSLYGTGTDPSFGARRVLSGALTTVGVAGRFYVTSLPLQNNVLRLFEFRDAANADQVTVCLQSTGTIQAFRGDSDGGTSLGTTASPVVTAGNWFHVEAKWVASSTVSATDGTVHVRVNGTEVLAITGVDNVATSNREVSQIMFMRVVNVTNAGPIAVDDIFAWNSSGAQNNNFVGDKDALYFTVNGDGGTSAWTRNTGSNDYEAVDELEQDGDTTYLEATGIGDTEDLEVETVPSTVTGIVAVVQVNLMRKTEAGTSTVKPSLVGGSGGEDEGSTHTLTESYAYYHDVNELNPDTSTAWTATTLSAAKIRLERVS